MQKGSSSDYTCSGGPEKRFRAGSIARLMSVALAAGLCAALLTPMPAAAQSGPSDDTVQVSPTEWSPIGSSILLDSPGVSTVLGPLSSIAAGTSNAPWKYDDTKFRLFRWIQDRWQEYSDGMSSAFSFVPGRVMWLKISPALQRTGIIDLGLGDSTSAPDTIKIAPKGWADFCIPFRYGVRLSDIFAASDSAQPFVVDSSLNLYRWTQTFDSTGQESFQYKCDLIFNSSLSGFSNPDTVLGNSILQGNTFTMYNARPADTISLIIPNKPASGVAKLAAGTQPAAGWTVAVNAATSRGKISPVYCAWSNGAGSMRYFPSPGRWGDVSAGVYDPGSHEVYGSALARTSNSGGQTFELVFQNSGSSDAVVTYTAAPVAGMGSMTVSIIDPAGGGARQVSGTDKVTVTVPGNSKLYRYLTVGTAGYAGNIAKTVSQVDFSLKVTPNPVHGIAVIEYLVPYNSIQKVRCEVVDIRGRTVWSATAGSSLHPGLNTMQWNAGSKKPPAGAYIIRITGLDGNGVARAKRISKITYLP